jgi:hypothetical protein
MAALCPHSCCSLAYKWIPLASYTPSHRSSPFPSRIASAPAISPWRALAMEAVRPWLLSMGASLSCTSSSKGWNPPPWRGLFHVHGRAPTPESNSPFPSHGAEFLLPAVHVLEWRKKTFLCLWQVSPGRMWVCWKLQIFVLCSKIHISSFRAPKIVKFVLLSSLWNSLSIRSIGWHVLVEKVFCRNSYLKTGLDNKRTCFSP